MNELDQIRGGYCSLTTFPSYSTKLCDDLTFGVSNATLERSWLSFITFSLLARFSIIMLQSDSIVQILCSFVCEQVCYLLLHCCGEKEESM